jgi:ABC-type antimicrobial peptide transport system permease subunit
MLFPIALAGAVLIGLTAPGLIIIQSAKEAAILRVLGVTKKRARCMLIFEQIGLCVVGIILAAGGLVLYNSGLFMRSAETLAVCGVLYLLGCICAAFGASVSVTRRRILELLQ